ncbi:MAG: right-handed parallel beta-helix repeat-containing protein [Chitinophagaceae bacterium]|nr:right-handed parallel beta-helix repeat-containing protein [Chitinophagaceae bacterium]
MKDLKTFGVSLCFFLCIKSTSFANSYYFSSSQGDDGRTMTQAQNPSTPWKSITKLNSIIKSVLPGDSILFKRGDTFYGSIIVSISGSSGLPIVFSSYGSGPLPVISGLTQLSGWKDLGGGISGAACDLCKATENLLILNGKLKGIGRYPNTGYLTYQSYSGNNSITSDQLSGGINWVGADIVVRKRNWILDRNKIISQVGNTITFNPTSSYTSTNNYGFFIQNDQRTLDSLGEWYFNTGSKTMMVYFGNNQPGNYSIQTSTIDTLIYVGKQSYIVFENLKLEGANRQGFLIDHSNNITIRNCSIVNSGYQAIRSTYSKNFTLEGSYINQTLNEGVNLDYTSTYSTISGNIILNTGNIPGMGGDGINNYTAITPGQGHSLIKGNYIDSAGYYGIRFYGDSEVVENNVVKNFCYVKDDGAGIYTYTGPDTEIYQQRQVKNNIVLNGIGAPDGANGNSVVRGIYMDFNSSQVSILNNTVANIRNGGGIFLLSSHDIDVSNNKVFNSKYNLFLQELNNGDFHGITMNNNQFVAKINSQYASWVLLGNGTNDIPNWGKFDYNYYTRPINENKSIRVDTSGKYGSATYRNLGEWITYSSQDKNSSVSKVPATDTGQIFLFYNPSNTDSVALLSGSFTSIDGVKYSNSVTLKPFTSLILIQTSTNIPPVANAGPDQTITLPMNSVTLNGSGTDKDGKVVSFKWTKIAGPANFNISSPSSASTDVTGMVQGVYLFQLQVTDDKGAIGLDTVKVTINSAIISQPPLANGGADIVITLPSNSVSLSGSGSDQDGKIVTYQWTKISGPSSYSILTPDSAATKVTGLVQGVYFFQFKVTDDSGATGLDTVKVTVNAALNIAPVADAGIDQTITLPTNTVTLTGSGSDQDGKIVSYKWTKIFGPTGFTITNAGSPVTSVSGLMQGIYQIQLQVTDDSGAVGLDTVKVTVNAALNIAPVANAGPDQTITLPTNTVTLTGSGSDQDGKIVSYKWTKISGPSGFTITNASSPVTSVSGLMQGVYQIQLQVTDDSGAVGLDTVKVTVNAALNIAPVANAGPDQTITLPTNTVTLTGSGSDQDGKIVSYKWTKISGPTGFTITNAGSPVTSVSGLTQGVYQIQLQVTDDSGAIGLDTMKVTVNAALNIPPVANAGPDQTITLPTNTFTLTGSGSDQDGKIVSYKWTKISGPSGFTITNASSPVTSVSNLVQGIYQFQLQVTDDSGAIGLDTMKVTVNAALNIPPVANAGPDQTITLPTNTVTLTGSGSDQDGKIVSYKWTKISGPSGFTITNAGSPVTSVSNLVQGAYYFQLQVTDDGGAIGLDTVKVTVNAAAANKVPIVSAGQDQTIKLPVNYVTLSGTATDEDGKIVTLNWTKISGPSNYQIMDPDSLTTLVTSLTSGTYTFQLSATDNSGSTSSATVDIIVTAGNKHPIANAGGNISITLPDDKAKLTGSGVDSDGGIVSYEWNQISGPAEATIITSDSAQTYVENLQGGNYQFELTVTDNEGATGKDTMFLTVNVPRLGTNNTDIWVYPNPTPNQATLELIGSPSAKKITISIVDMNGRVLSRQSFDASEEKVYRESLDLRQFIKGFYLIVVQSQDGQILGSKKILKLR